MDIGQKPRAGPSDCVAVKIVGIRSYLQDNPIIQGIHAGSQAPFSRRGRDHYRLVCLLRLAQFKSVADNICSIICFEVLFSHSHSHSLSSLPGCGQIINAALCLHSQNTVMSWILLIQ